MVKLKPKKQIDVYQEVWRKYSSPIMDGKFEPLEESFTWHGREWANQNNPPFLACVFKMPSEFWEPIQLVQAELERTDLRQRYYQPNYFHVTLEEYGWEDEVSFEHIAETMREMLSGYRPFTIELKGLNCFSRTLFVKVFDRSRSFSGMYKDIHKRFPNSKKEHPEYIPHLAVADVVTDEARDLIALIEKRYREERIGQVNVDRIHIVRARPYLTVGRVETVGIIPLNSARIG